MPDSPQLWGPHVSEGECGRDETDEDRGPAGVDSIHNNRSPVPRPADVGKVAYLFVAIFIAMLQ